MGSGEKKVVAVLAVILLALLGVYFGMPPKTGGPAAPVMSMQGGAGGPGGAPAAGPGGPGQMAQGPAGRGRMAGAGPGGRGAMQQAAAGSGPGCSTTGGSGAGDVPTVEMGKKGARVDIAAILPITHGCHVNTEATVKQIAKEHPNDVHLVVVDLFGKEGPTYLQKYGLTQSAAVVINGKTNFQVKGRNVQLLRTEGGGYVPADIPVIVDDLLKGKKS